MDMKDVYIKSAALLESAKDELLSDGATGFRYEFHSLKFSASLMHNDVCREFHNLTINPTMGTSNLLSYGSIILKLFEANLWYSQVGNRRLRELAKSRGKLQLIEDKLKEMKLILRPNRIEKYAEIRNKLAGHYDNQIVNILQELAAIRPDAFFEDIEMVVRYSQEWLQALRSIGKLEVPDRGGPGNPDRVVSGSLASPDARRGERRSEAMKRTRRHHVAAYKTQVAFAAIKGEKTLAELATQFGVHPTQITEWKQQLLTRAVDVCGGTTKATLDAPDLKVLHAKIGQLALEHDC